MVGCMVAACAGSSSQAGDDVRQVGGNATVIRNSEMTGSVLHTLRTRLPSIRISTEGQRCPSIRFRGDLSMHNQPEPSIYIDGGIVGDTCALEHIAAHEVDRIEVYPSGDTPYSEIRRNPAGLILIFRRQD
jgi:hypothetical protein